MKFLVSGCVVSIQLTVGRDRWRTYHEWRSSQSFGPQCSAKLHLFDYRTVTSQWMRDLGVWWNADLLLDVLCNVLLHHQPEESPVITWISYLLNVELGHGFLCCWNLSQDPEIQMSTCHLSIPTSIASCCMSSLCRNLALGTSPLGLFRFSYHVGGLDLCWASTSAIELSWICATALTLQLVFSLLSSHDEGRAMVKCERQRKRWVGRLGTVWL